MNEDIIDDGIVHLSGEENSQPLDAQTGSTLIDAAKWGKYYLIIAAVGLLIQPIIQYVNMRKVETALEGVDTNLMLGVQFGTQVFTYLIIIAIFGYPIYRFYEFTQKTPSAIDDQSHKGFVEGILALTSTFKYLGIATLVVVGFYALMLVLGFLAAIFIGLAQ